MADVIFTGPIADGTASAVLDDWAVNTARVLGEQGEEMLRAFPMNKSGRASGGFQANLHMVQKGPVARITAPMIKGVTWGPWLEGTSKRNESTRFKGYGLFRLTQQELQKMAPEVGQAQLDAIMPRLGGG